MLSSMTRANSSDRSRSRGPHRLRVSILVSVALPGAIVSACTSQSAEAPAVTSYSVSDAKALVVNGQAGSLRVSVADGPVTVEETSRQCRGQAVTRHNVTDGTLNLIASWSGLTACSVDYVVTVPSSFPLTASVKVGSIDVDGSSGSLDLSSSAGSIGATRLGARQARFRASTGSIDAAFINPPDGVDAQSNVGDVTVHVPSAGSFNVQAKTDIGSTKVDVLTDASAPRKIRATTHIGGVKIVKS